MFSIKNDLACNTCGHQFPEKDAVYVQESANHGSKICSCPSCGGTSLNLTMSNPDPVISYPPTKK